jgi:hypothetical protein
MPRVAHIAQAIPEKERFDAGLTQRGAGVTRRVVAQPPPTMSPLIGN